MNIETILTTIDYLEKLKLQGEDGTLDKLILFWRLQANQHETPVIEKFAVMDVLKAHLIAQNGKFEDKMESATRRASAGIIANYINNLISDIEKLC